MDVTPSKIDKKEKKEFHKILRNMCNRHDKNFYTKFKFEKNDTILFGRESAGVPESVHKLIKDRLKIPMKINKRSLNIASSVAIVLAENLRQTELI